MLHGSELQVASGRERTVFGNHTEAENTYFCPHTKKRALTKNQEDIAAGMKLPLMEQFYTIQGEGANSGRAAYFIRLAGCDVGCSWCDVKESWMQLNIL